MKIEVIYEENTDVILRARAEEEHCNGFELMGKGVFSRVYSSPDTPYVVKVMRGDDAGYLSFIKTISEVGKDLENVPRVFRIIHYRYARDEDYYYKTPGASGQDAYVFYMEKLRQPRRRSYSTIKLLTDNTYSSTIRPVDTYAKLLSKYVEDYRNACRRGVSSEKFNRLNSKNQNLIALLALAGELLNTQGNLYDVYDIHAGNVMCRNRRFVVTDPLVG